MKRLLKTYGFNSDMQYFERIVTLYKSKEQKAAKVMFQDMPFNYRKTFINAALAFWQSTLSNEELSAFVALI